MAEFDLPGNALQAGQIGARLHQAADTPAGEGFFQGRDVGEAVDQVLNQLVPSQPLAPVTSVRGII